MRNVELNPDMGIYAERRAMRPRIIIPTQDNGLILKQYIPTESAAAVSLIDRSREHLNQYGENTGKKYWTVEDFEDSVVKPTNPDRLRFGIWTKENELVGSINLTPHNDEPFYGDIGYYLGKGFTGRDITRRATIALSEYAFNEQKFKALFATTHIDNIASQKVLFGAGFSLIAKGADKLRFQKMKPQ